MHTLMATYLSGKAAQYAALARATTHKAEGDEDDDRKRQLAAYLEALDNGEVSWSDLPAKVEAVLKPLVQAGAQDGLAQLDVHAGIDFDVVNEAAVEWARDRSAELVGMKYVDGELVENPNAEWSISDSTEDMLRDLITTATEEGWSMDTLAAEIAQDGAFSDERAMTIARTESATADVQGNMVGYREARDQLDIVVDKAWITAADDLVSEDCAANGEQGPIGLDDTFQSGADAPPEHPNCLTGDAVVTALGVSRYFKRRFVGEVVVIGAAGIDDLTITPNHPVLTRRGWVAAGALQLGDEMVQCLDPAAFAAAHVQPENDHVETRIEQVFDAGLVARGVPPVRVPAAPEHFHGDGMTNGEVHVVRSDRFLPDNRAEAGKNLGDNLLGIGHGPAAAFHSSSTAAQLIEGCAAATNSGMSSADEGGASFWSGLLHSQGHAGAGVAYGEAHRRPALAQAAAVATDSPGYIDARLAGHVSLVKIERLSSREYDGHVYNLETAEGWYMATGIVVHNCRCDLLPVRITDNSESDE